MAELAYTDDKSASGHSQIRCPLSFSWI